MKRRDFLKTTSGAAVAVVAAKFVVDEPLDYVYFTETVSKSELEDRYPKRQGVDLSELYRATIRSRDRQIVENISNSNGFLEMLNK